VGRKQEKVNLGDPIVIGGGKKMGGGKAYQLAEIGEVRGERASGAQSAHRSQKKVAYGGEDGQRKMPKGYRGGTMVENGSPSTKKKSQ